MRPRDRNLERNKKIIWMRTLRERTQNLSVAFRPQMVRSMWMVREALMRSTRAPL